MITFPVRGTFLGMCCLVFFVFFGIVFGSMDFLGGFELPKNQWIGSRDHDESGNGVFFWQKMLRASCEFPLKQPSFMIVFLLLIYVYICHHQ